jgi:putative RNA 2'-phosphotransferase
VDGRRQVKVSKYLAKHLRHQPERLGLTLHPGGWVRVDELLAACTAAGFEVSRPELEEVVARSDKQRFSFDDSGALIRANQGHSVPIDLALEAVHPPDVLYHGTGAGSVDAILREGLRAMGRHHVHLSSDVETARRVGARHGRPVVLAIDTATMAAHGHVFFRSANGVWLTELVPSSVITRV